MSSTASCLLQAKDPPRPGFCGRAELATQKPIISMSLLREDLVLDVGILATQALQARYPITFKIVTTAVIATLRFLPPVDGGRKKAGLKISINSDDQSLDQYDPELVKSITCVVQSRDAEKLRQLGGLHGLACHLHTDLARGLPAMTNAAQESLGRRKRVFGENAYPHKSGKTLLGFLGEACYDPTLITLMLCAALSLGFGIKTDGLKEGWYDGASIAFAVLLVVVVTSVSNYKQSRQFQRLTEERGNIQVHVLRGGRSLAVPIIDVVVGDLVELGIGDQVPADGLLVQGRSLAIDESSFTGESDYYLPQEEAFLRSGSKVQDGYGSMLVTSVGINTEWGRMMTQLSDTTASEKTPLQKRLTKAASMIGTVGLSVAAVVLIILLVFYFTGRSSTGGAAEFQAGQTSATHVMDALVHIFSIAVTIVVVAVPEGLPLAVTLTLAYSMRKMMADSALVRRLAACEAMGSATTICSDKTGTLTTNQMTVVKAWITGKGSVSEGGEEHTMSKLPNRLQNLLFQGITQNSMGSVFKPSSCDPSCPAIDQDHAEQVEVTGSPTEKAILWWGLKAGMSFKQARAESTVLQVETFNSTKKRAGVAVRMPDERVLVHWKGAAESILSMCDKWIDINKENAMQEMPMTVEKRQELGGIIEGMAACSLRCVALAYCDMTHKHSVQQGISGSAKWCLPDTDLTLLAVLGMKDPCRPGVRTAVEAVQAAGVKVRMVTGDNLATAKECGILGESEHQLAVDGETLRGWTEGERRDKLPIVAVVARALPSDKLLLVETLQSMGEVVAVTGDGTNDALALQKADIGLSMGIQGTEVAKESSDIIILDDNFTSIVKVVRWGRGVYFNIQKFLQFQLTVNMAALVINFVAAVTSGDVPLTAVQLLWVNLIMDTLGALALATEPPTDELMKKPPVGHTEPLITNLMWQNLAFQAIYQIIVLLTLQFHGESLLGLSGMTDASLINRTVIFNTFVLCQLFNEVNARQPYRRNIFHGLLDNRLFIGIVATTLVLQVVMVEFLERFASTVRLDWQHWLVCIGLASLSWPIAFLAKATPLPLLKGHLPLLNRNRIEPLNT